MSFATKIEAATPVGRDRALDGLRALAVAGVVVGHFLVMALVPDAAGALRVKSPLTGLPDFAPLSWALQLLALFFLVGGYSAARSREHREYRPWIRRRLVRLVRPVVGVTALLALSFPALAVLGVPSGTLRTTTALVIQPLWFIGVYGVVTALTPVAAGMVRRWGAWAVVPLVLVVAVVDVLRYGGFAPGWIGLVNVLPGWAFAYVLGVAWARGALSRRFALGLVGLGAVLLVALVWRFGYPASVVGVPGAGRVNSHPPSLLVVALAMAQCGLAVLARDRLGAWLRRPRRWAAVAMLNLVAMTVFCWHQVALVLLTSVTLPLDLQGLHQPPDGLAWAGWRLAWLPVHVGVLAGLVWAARRFEAPWTGTLKRLAPVAALAALGFGAYALAVL
ncbi:acyltransferase [Cryptosporangium sp. NPDC051539]|uniref:acyltransferase n=1 Tax=Cryptosporangium sp. NPDC051539 TaxID=3363962 RepID=UPI0037A03347